MIETVKEEVSDLLAKDASGHGMDHIERVLRLSLKFAEKEKEANKDIVTLIALLHDVDDYKLFGHRNAENLTNAREILNKANINEEIKEKVLSSLDCIGYSKLLSGKRPESIEGKIVSDADMCDAIGANGILRVHQYTLKQGRPFFDKNVFPIEDVSADTYSHRTADSSVCHFFEKILKLKGLMLTTAGEKEVENRHQLLVDFLYQLFDEEAVSEWKDYLNNYLCKFYN